MSGCGNRLVNMGLGKLKASIVDLLLCQWKKGNTLFKMLSWMPSTRLVAASSFILFGFASLAMADTNPFDPHALFADGGDATDIDSGQPITLSAPGGGNTGGGIFVFSNNTGSPLSGVNVDITLPNSFGAFSFTGTIFTPGPGTTSTTETIAQGPCDPSLPAASFCVELAFSAGPQPLVPEGGNFVLDFDKPAIQGPPPVYGGVDELVATGAYTGGTDTSDARIGEWSEGAIGFVAPIIETPEPRYYGGLLVAFMALSIYFRRLRNAVAR